MRLALAALLMCAGGCDIILRLDHQDSRSDAASSDAAADTATGDTVNSTVVLVQSTSVISSTAINAFAAWPMLQQPGDLNVIIIGWTSSTSSISTVSDTGGNMYKVGAASQFSNGLGQVMYYAANIAGGSGMVTVTFNNATTNVDVRMLEYSGIATTNPVDSSATGAGAGFTMTTGALTTTHPHTIVVAGFMSAGQTVSAGPMYTSRVLTISGNSAEDRELFTAGPAEATATQDQSGAFMGHAAAFVAR